MRIPEEAVDAAYCELPDGAGRYVNRDDIRVILEAAAPFIAEAVLNEAADRADEQEMSTLTPHSLRRRAKSYRPAK